MNSVPFAVGVRLLSDRGRNTAGPVPHYPQVSLSPSQSASWDMCLKHLANTYETQQSGSKLGFCRITIRFLGCRGHTLNVSTRCPTLARPPAGDTALAGPGHRVLGVQRGWDGHWLTNLIRNIHSGVGDIHVLPQCDEVAGTEHQAAGIPCIRFPGGQYTKRGVEVGVIQGVLVKGWHA